MKFVLLVFLVATVYAEFRAQCNGVCSHLTESCNAECAASTASTSLFVMDYCGKYVCPGRVGGSHNCGKYVCPGRLFANEEFLALEKTGTVVEKCASLCSALHSPCEDSCSTAKDCTELADHLGQESMKPSMIAMCNKITA